VNEWVFPEKLLCFDPLGTKYEEVFRDPVALIAYAQYRRKHIISDKENEWLPKFAKTFSDEIHKLKEEHSKKTLGFTDRVNLQDVVEVWEKLFAQNPRGRARDETRDKWIAMLEPILPYLNGELTLKFVRYFPSCQCYLVTEKEK